MEKASTYKLDYLQLHGNESPEDCHTLQKRGVGVFGEGVENTPQAQPFFAGGLRFRFDSAAHIFPGRPRMDGS